MFFNHFLLTQHCSKCFSRINAIGTTLKLGSMIIPTDEKLKHREVESLAQGLTVY